MKPTHQNPLRTGAKVLLKDPQKRLLTRVFGQRWRAPLLHLSGFGPTVTAMKDETIVLGGCHHFATIRGYYDVVGPHGHIVAIEANAGNVERLRREIENDPELSKANNVTLVAKGIWDKQGKATFVANAGDNPALDKIASEKLRDFSYSKVDASTTFEIEVDSLDNILKEVGIEKVDLVVLTINDAELLALDGVDRLIRDNPNVRFVTYSHCPYPCGQVKQKLVDKGYKVFGSRIRRSSLEKIYAFRVGSESAHRGELRAS
jgi:FkbM family methyltransferase